MTPILEAQCAQVKSGGEGGGGVERERLYVVSMGKIEPKFPQFTTTS